jgi:hypothetical protein
VLNAMPAFALPISGCSDPNHSGLEVMQGEQQTH